VFRSCLIRNAHAKAVANNLKLGPSDEELIYTQGNIAGVVAGSFYNRTLGERKKISDGKPHHWQFKAQGARQPGNAVERIDSTRR
jgi:hypothetical protein